MTWAATSASRPRYPHSLDEALEQANALFTRVRHRNDAAAGEPACVTASRQSVAYVEAFWPLVAEAIANDPRGLGMQIDRVRDGATHLIEVAGIRRAMLAGDAGREARIKAFAFAPLVLMSQLLNDATAAWAEELRSGRCPLAFEVDAARYVSLRALLPRRSVATGAVGGNAPTLVMGGTATALGMCWNLLYQLPRGYRELAGREPDRRTMERLWADTRELIFRIGTGSLAAFVAFASACSSKSEAMVWDGAGGLGLAERGARIAWMMSEPLRERFQHLLEGVRVAQDGHYVGCAALYARAAPLPLAPAFADPREPGRDAIVFNEIIRWITAVARAEYFPCFEDGSAGEAG